MASALLALASAVILHACLVRVAGSLNKVVAFLATGGLVGLALVVYEIVWSAHTTLESLAALAVYAAACELYIFAFTLVVSSVSVAVLTALDGGPLSEDALEHHDSSRAMVETRLERLAMAGCVDLRDGVCLVTPRGRALAGAFERLRRTFGHAP